MKSVVGVNTIGVQPYHTGCKVYLTNLLEGLKEQKSIEYLLITSKSNYKLFDKFAKSDNVTRSVLPIDTTSPYSRVLAEEVYVPYVCANQNVDLLFGPRNHLPLIYRGESVVTMHSKHINYSKFPDKFSTIQKAYANISMKATLNRASIVIAITKHIKNTLINMYNIEEKKIKVVYEGVNSERFGKCGSRKSGPKESREDEPYILYLSNITEHKNVDKTIRSFAKFKRNYREKNIKLYIAGGGNTSYVQDMKQLADDLKVKEDVIFMGKVPSSEVPSLYSNAEIFMFLSRVEGFGLPILEAMASGTPVIGSNYPPIPEVMGSAGVNVDPSNVSVVSQKIYELLNNQKKRERLVKKGIERAKTFNWCDTARKTNKILNEVLNGIDR